ncbi:MAG: hypothetical protein ACOZF0_13135 [Thermodesulfobacteriota bacterium]
MNRKLQDVLTNIYEEFKDNIAKGARHYLQVDIGQRAGELGYSELKDQYRLSSAVVPLKNPVRGMKVRIDGRTFTNYAQFDSGIVVPDYVAKDTGMPYGKFVPNDSMILNFH